MAFCWSFMNQKAVRVDSSFLKLFLDPFSELTRINVLSSQSGFRWNPLLPLCSALWFPAWYSMSTQSTARPTVVSKNSSKGWHNCFQMNDCKAAQSGVDVRTIVVREALWFGPLEGDRQEKTSPLVTSSSFARWTWAESCCRTLYFYNEHKGTWVIYDTFWPSLGGNG